MEKQNGSSKVWFVVVLVVIIVIGFSWVVSAFNAAGNVPAPSAPATSNTQSAGNLSEQVGVSPGDAQTIQSIVSRRFTNSTTQQAIETNAAKLDLAGAGSATDITNELSDIVQGWSMSADGIPTTVNDLYTASQSSAYDFKDFSNIIVQATPDLVASGMSFQSSVDTLAALSTQSGMTSETAQSTYLQVAADLNPANVKEHAALLQIPGVPKDAQADNFPGVLTDMEAYYANNKPSSN